MELLVLGLLRDAGLPEPELQHSVYDGDRFVASVDLAYPDLKIAIECDGSVHLEEGVRDEDLRKQNELILLGWTVIRFSWNDTRRRPDRVPEVVREAIRQRS
jgi:very-short-patch-repair endonuclease